MFPGLMASAMAADSQATNGANAGRPESYMELAEREEAVEEDMVLAGVRQQRDRQMAIKQSACLI